MDPYYLPLFERAEMELKDVETVEAPDPMARVRLMVQRPKMQA